MDAIKTILMGCGALALLSVVGCVGLTSAGYYALESAVEEAEARRVAGESNRPRRSVDSYQADPFGDYESQSYDDNGNQVGGWSDDAE